MKLENPFAHHNQPSEMERDPKIGALAHKVLGPGAQKIAAKILRGREGRSRTARADFTPSPEEQRDEHEARFFYRLQEKERNILSAFFDETINIPPLPKATTREQLENWEAQGFVPHFLPDFDLLDSNGRWKQLPSWTQPPDFVGSDFTQILEDESTHLLKGWRLCDIRRDPKASLTGNHMYEHDVFYPILKHLRENGMIPIRKGSSSMEPVHDLGTRYSVSRQMLSNPEIKRYFAEILCVSTECLDLPSFLEANILYHLHTLHEPPMLFEHYRDRIKSDVTNRGTIHGRIPTLYTTSERMYSPTTGFRYIAKLS